MVADLNVCDALTDRLDDTGTLVPENNGESTLGVFAGESVGIWAVLDFVSAFGEDAL